VRWADVIGRAIAPDSRVSRALGGRGTGDGIAVAIGASSSGSDLHMHDPGEAFPGEGRDRKKHKDPIDDAVWEKAESET